MNHKPYTRLEDILTGPWSRAPLFSVRTWSEDVVAAALKVGAEARTSVPIRSCNAAIHNDLEVATLIDLAVRSGFISVTLIRDYATLFIQPILLAKSGEDFIRETRYWGVIDLISRLNIGSLREPVHIDSITSSLQVYFASLLTTHRSVKSATRLRNALWLLGGGSVKVDHPLKFRDPSNPLYQALESYTGLHSLLTTLQSRSPVERMHEDGLIELLLAVFDIVEMLAQLFLPMEPEQRGVLGVMYLRELRTLNAAFLRRADSYTGNRSAQFDNFETLERVMLDYSYLLQRMGSSAFAKIPYYLGILEETRKNIETMFWGNRRQGGGGGNLQDGEDIPLFPYGSL